MKKTMIVHVTFDLDKVNDALGNTRNVTAEKALMELLQSCLHEYGLHDSYGWPIETAPQLEKHVTFEICEEAK